MKWTRDKVLDAKYFEVLRGCRGDCSRATWRKWTRGTPARLVRKKFDVRDGDELIRGVDDLWSIFEVGSAYDDEVHEELVSRGTVKQGESLDFTPQREDDGAPQDYDDIDAAVDALNAGYTLVKLPDWIDAKYYRLYVLDDWKPRDSPQGWFHAMKSPRVSKDIRKALAGVRGKKRDLIDFINRHRREIGQAPLDPAQAGWSLGDIGDEAARIRALPKGNRRKKKGKAKPKANPRTSASSIMRRFMRL